MTNVFESYLALAEQDPHPGSRGTLEDRASSLEDQVAAHTAIFQAMESRLGDQGLTESHRPLIPLYQRWMNAARQLVVRARELRAQGRPVAGVDELVCAINGAKDVAEDFDHTVELTNRIRRGEPPGPSRPLQEVLDELRAADRQHR